jgi:hypothetical protein
MAIGAALGIVTAGAVWRWSPPEPAPAPTIAAAPESVVTGGAPAGPQAAQAVAGAEPQPAHAPVPAPAPARLGEGGRSAAAPVAAAQGDEAVPAPAAEIQEEPETEPALLARAQDALGHDPGAALAATEAHRRRFPGGVLAQEREVIAIAALARLGRTAEAEAAARRFLSAYPRSAHRRRIEVLVPGLGGEAVAPSDDRRPSR